MQKKARLFLFFALLFILLSSLSMNLFAKELLLNGEGYREATLFNIKVYKAQFFLENKSSDAKKIIESSEEKKLVMTFLRDVEKEKMLNGWDESFKKNLTSEQLVKMGPAIEKFKATVSAMKKDDVIEIAFHGQKSAEIIDNQKKKTLIEDPLFTNFLLSIWLGENPPNQSLKKGILGL